MESQLAQLKLDKDVAKAENAAARAEVRGVRAESDVAKVELAAAHSQASAPATSLHALAGADSQVKPPFALFYGLLNVCTGLDPI